MSTQTGPNTPGGAQIGDDGPFTIAVYTALREEILKRIELQQQLTLALLVALATFISTGIQLNSPVLPLVFPLVATFLAAAWLYHHVMIQRIAQFIADKLEPRYGGAFLWEAAHQTSNTRGRWRWIGSISAAIYVGTQYLAVGMCVLILWAHGFKAVNPGTVAFIICDVILASLTVLGLTMRWLDVTSAIPPYTP